MQQEGIDGARREKGQRDRAVHRALAHPAQTPHSAWDFLGFGQSKGRLTTRIKPTEKNLALDDLELLFNPETAQLSEFGI